MSFGLTTKVAEWGGTPPGFVFTFTQAGDSAYVAGGTTGLLAALQAKYGKQYTIVSAHGFALVGTGLKRCVYDVATDKLICVLATGTEEANGSLAAVVYNITAVCK